MSHISMTEISRNFSDFINRVAYRDEHFTIWRGKKAVAEIRPIPAGKTLGDMKNILESLPKFSPREAEEFGTDLEEIRKEGNQEMLGEPWES
jgi:antitoxin (DNA-binding transcriptional repressor) of toxin-antitoxin stability system